MELKNPLKKICLGFALILSTMAFTPASHANTRSGQFQLGTGIGVFVGTGGLDAAFDIALEPEFFVTQHISLAVRFDGTVGGTDSVHFGGRFRYYFNFPNESRWSIFVGAGAGYVAVFNGPGTTSLGDFAIPVFGFQYDITDHVKLGSDFSFDIVFNGDRAEFATRLLPVSFRWAF